MAVKTYKPTSPARRAMTGYSFDEITRQTPEKSLLAPLISRGGRNNHGHLTVRHQGGGAKRMYRLIDFKRSKDDIPAKVFSIEYDPNRTARIALICYADGEKSYILAPVGLKVGDTVISGESVDIKPGNALPLRKIPVGTLIHNIELKIGKGGQLVRSAGVSAQLMAKESEYVHVRLPSNEMRLIHGNCKASIGEVGNLEHENVKIGKAGRSRHMGIRPTVRGVVMNPVDHPHGGGEGRSPVGHKSPLSPWGQKTNGFKTRKKKASDKYIVTRRSK